MRALPALLALLLLPIGPAQAQEGIRIYERGSETAAAAFPDAGKAGSALHRRMAEVDRELERKGDPVIDSSGRPVIVAVRAAALLRRERPEAAPNPSEVTARCLGLVEKTYGALNASSPFARTFWEFVPEVRAKLEDFNSTGAWPLAAGALAEWKLAGSPLKSGSRTGGPDFALHQAWLAVGGGSEWPPKSSQTRTEPVTITQTSPDTWQGSDGTIITRTGPAQFQVTK